MEPVHEIFVLRAAGLLKARHDEVPLGINVRSDVVGDLAGRVAQANPLVERRRTEPDRTSVFQFVPPPEPDMVPLARAVADRQLEGQVLFAVKEKKVADRGIVVGLAEGDPVTVALKWPSAVKLDNNATMGTRNNPPSGKGHMVVLVGYDIDAAQPGGGHCQIRNSWGEKWGENGYAWVTFEYLKKNGDEAYAVKAF